MDRSAVDRLYDCDVLDRHGRPIGPVAELWLAGGRPLWASVRRDGGTTLVPIRGAQVRDRRLVVPVEEHEVQDAPKVGDRDLSEAEQAELHDHYRLALPEQRLVRHRRASATTNQPPPQVRRRAR
ncbi:PRC-barrel domain-containing protein [Actinosynnema sp. NPDC053489]|uniref:PRC-barrel domain-containing protein n=1 Tax=Actinosynnema sp. NPDC053489 TaxID=3363916 RepID=UPI0037C74FB8